MKSATYLHVTPPVLSICYRGTSHEFDIRELKAIYVSKKRIPFYQTFRLLLLVGAVPLVLFCLDNTSLWVTVCSVSLYCVLLVVLGKKTYSLCVLTNDGKMTVLKIRRSEKRAFVEQVSDFLEEYYDFMRTSSWNELIQETKTGKHFLP